MRIAIAGFAHESNTFAAKPTQLEDFEIYRGKAMIDHYAPTFHEIAGFIAGAEEYDFDLHATVGANATPSGTVMREAYETIIGEILANLSAAKGRIDGVLLALHGAMVTEEYPQGDGETVRRVRELMGPDFPIVVTHDYHGNIPEQLVRDSNAMIIYKTNPHIDQRERGLQAANLLVRTIRKEVNPVSAIRKPQVLFNIAFHNTSLPPMQPIMQAAIDLEKEPGILAVSIAAGYQYADVPSMGPSIVVVADGDQALAERGAQRIADMMWAARDQLTPNLPDPVEAVRLAMNASATPVSLFDAGDNVGGGSAADSTLILEELLAQKADGWVIVIYDPESVQAAFNAGVGATVSLKVGGKADKLHGPTVPITGRVRTLHDGTFEETERRHGGRRYWDAGLSAVIEVNRTAPGKGGLIVLNSERTPPMSIHQLTSVGIVPQQHKILVAKGTVAPRAAYAPVSADIIIVDSGGACDMNRDPNEFKLARRDFYEWAK